MLGLRRSSPAGEAVVEVRRTQAYLTRWPAPSVNASSGDLDDDIPSANRLDYGWY